MSEDNQQQSGLSADIHLLGDLLGQVIREQHGQKAFQLVESVRTAAKVRRSDDDSAAADLTHKIENLDLESAHVLIKAFSNYFQLINIAEDQQRIRVLRQREREGSLGESLHEAIGELHDAGFTAAQMRNLLETLRIRLVMTAHPTEAKRKEVLVKQRHIAEVLNRRSRSNLLPRESKFLQHNLLEEIEELWQTRPTRASRPTVADEVDFSVYFLTSVIMDISVDILAEIRLYLGEKYPDTDWAELPSIIQYASWVGGDRDGNPFVTPEVTLNTLTTLRNATHSIYVEEVTWLREHLTQALTEVGISDELRQAVDSSSTDEYPGEPYRQHMEQIRLNLVNNIYQSGKPLLSDLQIAYNSLSVHGGQHVASGSLRRLIDKVRLFGLHLVPLEVREDARRNAQALDDLFRHFAITDSYLELPEEEKQQILLTEIENRRPLFPPDPSISDVADDVIATWRMVADVHQQYGSPAIDTIIASMSKHPSDVLSMLLLASEVGIQDDVDLMPLFETIDDLNRAPAVMQTLFETPVYWRHIEVRGRHQAIMIGYSDSGKDGGYMASAWGLYRAQQTLAGACAAYDVQVELFHGRGGSIGRGGGPTNRAILAQPPSAMRGRIRITEQGEVIAYRYSNPGIARRHLHQVLHASLIATALHPTTGEKHAWKTAMNRMAEAAMSAYREFVYERDGFLDYWKQATPIDVLTRLQIGSRPAKRRSGGFDAVRAIPWVFSWMQNRAIIPSWYGMGTGLAAYGEDHANGLDILREMYFEWPMFQAMIENVQLDLAKADLEITSLYNELVQEQNLQHRFFTSIQDEYQRATSWINRIIGQEKLLGNNPVLQRSIERRNPYVDPLNFIQVSLLSDFRHMDEKDPQYEHLLGEILATINGIAAGMKTTG